MIAYGSVHEILDRVWGAVDRSVLVVKVTRKGDETTTRWPASGPIWPTIPP